VVVYEKKRFDTDEDDAATGDDDGGRTTTDGDGDARVVASTTRPTVFETTSIRS
jgi:hypothetical protein